MGDQSTTYWIEFFRNAGLPYNVAANYAIIFYDNRIQLDMLMDLSKEYLYDMGIKTMGDVIAILRHSKDFHNQLTKEKMIGAVQQASSSQKSPSRMSASRMLEHYTRSRATLKAVPQTRVTQPARASPATKFVPKSKPHAVVSSPVKRRISPPNTNEISKIRRVMPEDEGAYNISMPTGNTERSRKLLQQNTTTLPVKRSSVFQRLGDSQVSSSTDVQRSQVKSNQSSVFKRLGPSSGLPEVTTTTQRSNIIRTSVGSSHQNVGSSRLNVGSSRQNVVLQQQKQGISMSGPIQLPKTSIFSRVGGGTGMTQNVSSADFKRTVVNSSLQIRSGVSQINRILATSTPRPTVPQSRGVLGKRMNSTMTMSDKFSRLNRFSPIKPVRKNLTSPSVIGQILKAKRNLPVRQQAKESSVFQRLGK